MALGHQFHAVAGLDTHSYTWKIWDYDLGLENGLQDDTMDIPVNGDIDYGCGCVMKIKLVLIKILSFPGRRQFNRNGSGRLTQKRFLLVITST